jgi:hypothetical protein
MSKLGDWLREVAKECDEKPYLTSVACACSGVLSCVVTGVDQKSISDIAILDGMIETLSEGLDEIVAEAYQDGAYSSLQ